MTTTLANDRAALAALQAAHTQTIAMRAPGTITFAGNLWPDLTTGVGRQIEIDVREALTEARALIEAGLRTVKAARRGDQAAVTLMTTWFGPATVPGSQDDWWQGVDYILSKLDRALLRDISVYYRGADVVGQPNDYPANTPGAGTPLTATDVSGYAETYAGTNNLRIGLCRTFFARDAHKARSIRRKGFDSIGGVLVHEMSHNLASTDDHTDPAGHAYYGPTACRALVTTHNLARQAWYNADNIEYFCEEAYYGILPPQPVLPGLNVAALRNVHQQAVQNAQVPQTSQPVQTGVSVQRLRANFNS